MAGALPSSLTRLTQLMCLRGCRYNGKRKLPADGLLENLTSLEVLEFVTVTAECFVKEMVNLTRLRALNLTIQLPEDMQSWQGCGGAMAESLGNLHKIESLVITSKPEHSEFFDHRRLSGATSRPPAPAVLDCRSSKTLPTWINAVSRRPTLSYLFVIVWHERREDIQVLGTLPCLRDCTFRVVRRADRSAGAGEV
jgi:disease resistance protein RPM1